MSRHPLRRYHVSLHEWDIYRVTLEALDEVDAIDQAHALYREHGRDAFPHQTCGDDGFTAMLAETEVAS